MFHINLWAVVKNLNYYFASGQIMEFVKSVERPDVFPAEAYLFIFSGNCILVKKESEKKYLFPI